MEQGVVGQQLNFFPVHNVRAALAAASVQSVARGTTGGKYALAFDSAAAYRARGSRSALPIQLKVPKDLPGQKEKYRRS